jgi:hypothetical protein
MTAELKSDRLMTTRVRSAESRETPCKRCLAAKERPAVAPLHCPAT